MFTSNQLKFSEFIFYLRRFVSIIFVSIVLLSFISKFEFQVHFIDKGEIKPTWIFCK